MHIVAQTPLDGGQEVMQVTADSYPSLCFRRRRLTGLFTLSASYLKKPCRRAGIGVFAIPELSFLPEPLSVALHWISISLIAFSIAIIILLVVKELKRMRSEEASDNTRLNADVAGATPDISRKSGPMEFFDTGDSPPFPVKGYLLTALFAGLGMAVFMFSEEGYPSYKAQSIAKTWPTTVGVVEHSDVILNSINYPTSTADSRADLLFRYQVNGVTYRINEAYFGQTEVWIDSLSAHEEALRYPVGARVWVHYLPEDPSTATVETNYRFVNVPFIWSIVLGAFALLGLYSALEQYWRYIKSRRRYA